MAEKDGVLDICQNDIFFGRMKAVVARWQVEALEPKLFANLERVSPRVILPFRYAVAIKRRQSLRNEFAVVSEHFDARVAVGHGIRAGAVKLHSITNIAEKEWVGLS